MDTKSTYYIYIYIYIYVYIYKHIYVYIYIYNLPIHKPLLVTYPYIHWYISFKRWPALGGPTILIYGCTRRSWRSWRKRECGASTASAKSIGTTIWLARQSSRLIVSSNGFVSPSRITVFDRLVYEQKHLKIKVERQQQNNWE